MNITFVTVGKIKEKYFRDAIAEYQKRLSKYCKLDIIEVADEKTPDKASEMLENQVKQKEAERILKNVSENAYCIALAIDGKKRDSVNLAEHIEQLGLCGKSNLVFVIGGSLGLHDSVIQRADEKLSFSDMTFPHQLMRVILIEQIYRCYRIINGQKYHK
ncbi:MAG: 23S rRNA (pseudouridine(1915)-N(3))-methyltransferase RlmH [Lachnospiraceae bacterium]|nr:23S rRNA (pseudouridine(1915)-N(3))-methyltransferase RlmH [Lachnospiraceae bacterium]